MARRCRTAPAANRCRTCARRAICPVPVNDSPGPSGAYRRMTNGFISTSGGRLAAPLPWNTRTKSPARFDGHSCSYWQLSAVAPCADNAALWAMATGVASGSGGTARRLLSASPCVATPTFFPGDARHWASVVYDDAFTLVRTTRASDRQASRRHSTMPPWRAADIHGTDISAIAGDIKGALGYRHVAHGLNAVAALTGESSEMARCWATDLALSGTKLI